MKNEVSNKKMIKKWTDNEKELLIKYYPFLSSKEISEKYITNRTPSQITDHALKKLKLKKDKSFHKGWNKFQLDFLKDNYSKNELSLDKISDIIGKTKATITAMANSLDMHRSDMWDDNEKEIIKQFYPYMKTIDLKSNFSIDKTASQITRFANDNKIYKDSDFLEQLRLETALSNLEKVSDQKGENSPLWVKRFELECDNCGGEICRTENKINKTSHNFCGYKCMGEWMSTHLKGDNNPNFGNGSAWTEEMRLESASRSVKRLVDGDFKFSRTKPEKIVDDILDSLNFKFIPEYECKYYLVDRYLYNYSLMIEVQGNFYHCNPTMNLPNTRKDKIIRKDKAKNTYLKRYHNVNVLYLWEKDLNDNPNLCKELIKLYTNNDGDLENYHSFNYELLNGKLNLKDKIVDMAY